MDWGNEKDSSSSTYCAFTPNQNNGPNISTYPMDVIDLTANSETHQLFEQPHVIDSIDLTKPVTTSNVVDLTMIHISSPSISFVDLTDDNADVVEVVADLETSSKGSFGELQGATEDIVEAVVSVHDNMYTIFDVDGEIDRSSSQNVQLKDDTDSYDIDNLNEQLKIFLNEISILEYSDVDISDFANETESNFCLVQRYKLKACQIYAKITEYSGETQSMAKESIHFDATPFSEFNRKLQRMVNKNEALPDISDALECLKLCNRKYDYQLSKDDCIDIVENALTQIGHTLRKQRKINLDETFSYHTNDQEDPALNDVELRAKLDRNKNVRGRKALN